LLQQLRVFQFGALEDGQILVGIFPNQQKILGWSPLVLGAVQSWGVLRLGTGIHHGINHWNTVAAAA
jgi:hypothetical protein